MNQVEALIEMEHLLNRYRAGLLLLSDGHLTHKGVRHVQATNVEILRDLGRRADEEMDLASNELKEAETGDSS